MSVAASHRDGHTSHAHGIGNFYRIIGETRVVTTHHTHVRCHSYRISDRLEGHSVGTARDYSDAEAASGVVPMLEVPTLELWMSRRGPEDTTSDAE